MQQTAPKSLIPRAMLFGNPTRAQAQLSPDGKWLSWLAPKDGVLNIWVAPADDMNAARVISDDRKRGIRFHGWAPNGTHVLYFQDEGGDEDFHTFAVEVATREVRNLTPIKGVQAQMYGFSLDFPDTIAVGLTERDEAFGQTAVAGGRRRTADLPLQAGQTAPPLQTFDQSHGELDAPFRRGHIGKRRLSA